VTLSARFEAEPRSAQVRGRTLLYLAVLTILVAFCDPNEGLIAIPLEFFLKNRLELDAHELAVFRLVAAIPLYVSFAFGFARDCWNPLGLKDRGYLIIFSVLSAALYLVFAFSPLSYLTLLVAVFLLTSAYLFIDSARSGLSSTLARQFQMSGQVSALWGGLTALPTVAALVIGGRLSDALEHRLAADALSSLFLLAAAAFAALALYAAWKPRRVFAAIDASGQPRARIVDELRRFVAHRPIYPALGIWLLFKFAPGSSTPLQYYLQDTLHAADHVWGEWNAIFYAARIPVYVLYAVVCRHLPLKTLLWVGTLVTIPQFVPLLFVDSVQTAMLLAAPIGAMGAIANAAYLDLIIRACPAGLQGTMLMLAGALYYVADRFGDVIGIALYARGGFPACVALIVLAYALILPVLRRIPNDLVAYADRR
jgi:MFS family permease